MYLVVDNLTDEQYLDLREILELKHCKKFSMEDVKEIADNLIDFYLHLAYLQKKYSAAGS